MSDFFTKTKRLLDEQLLSSFTMNIKKDKEETGV